MIIKSMSRKEPSFSQLINYITRDRSLEKYDIYHNVFSHTPEEALLELDENARLLPKRKNGVVLYHEILSITKSDEISIEEQKQALSEIVRRYITERAGENLVFGGLHDEKDNNLHYHLVISANANGVSKRTRLSKAQFAKIQKDLESHVLEHYPQLRQQVAINKVAERKLSEPGAQLQKRTGQMPKREEMITKLARLFEADSKSDAASLLQAEGLAFYQRGKTIGVTNLETGKNHRLKTLGMIEDYSDFKARIELGELKEQTVLAQKTEKKSDEQAQKEKAELERQAAGELQRHKEVAQEQERQRQQQLQAERQRQEVEASRQAEDAERLQRAQETTRQVERQKRAEERQRQQQVEQAQKEQAERMERMSDNTRAIDQAARSEPEAQLEAQLEAQPEKKTGLRDMLEARREQMKVLRNRFRRKKGRTRS